MLKNAVLSGYQINIEKISDIKVEDLSIFANELEEKALSSDNEINLQQILKQLSPYAQIN